MAVYLSKNLVYLRKLKSLTQKDLAAKLSITPSAYGNYENNYSQPNYEILELITKVLGVNAHDLLFTDLQNEESKPSGVASQPLGKANILQGSDNILKLIESLRRDVEALKMEQNKTRNPK